MSKARMVGVAMDSSPASNCKSALLWTAENLLDDGDTMILIHVHPEKPGTGKMMFCGTPPIPAEEIKEVQEKYGLGYDDEILDVLDSLSNAKKVEVKAYVYWADAGTILIDAVRTLTLDSIVVAGSERLGSVTGFQLDSVSEYVVKNASCTVTVVKPK